MENTFETRVIGLRITLFGLGGLAALALWVLAENRTDFGWSPLIFLVLFVFVATQGGVALAFAGPLSVLRALKGALLVSVPVTALVGWASLRHTMASDLLDEPIILSLIWVLVYLATPFVLVWLETPKAWRSYGRLFDTAWTITVRYGVGLVFVGAFWLVVFLSNALFQLVDIGIIEWLLDTEWVPFGLSGAMLGLGLAVIYEFRRSVSPFLILRLLRLLVPVVLVVLIVFLGALPIRGLSGLFGEFSSAATLMSAAIVAITLISSALDRDDDHAARTKGLRLATQGLALLLPVLAGLAVWAVIVRVRQYGWTPDRVLAATVAGVVLAYGLGYAACVLRRVEWRNNVRQVNVAMAILVIVVTTLWLTPVLNPYRISASSQVARFQSGAATLDQLPLWIMQHQWGRAGQNQITRLAEMQKHADHAELVRRITLAREETSKYRYRRAIKQRNAQHSVAGFLDVLPVRPLETPLSAGIIGPLSDVKLKQWMAGCARKLPDGRAGCVFLSARFNPRTTARVQGIMLFMVTGQVARADHVVVRADGSLWSKQVRSLATDGSNRVTAKTITQVLDGNYDIRPSGNQALFVGDLVLTPGK